MAEETAKEAPAPKKPIAEAHPEMAARHARIGALIAAAHAAARRGEPLAGAERAEADGLAAWAGQVVAETVGDVAAFRARMDRDRPAFAAALRLSGDEQVAAQLLVAADDLRSVL
ncbi:MAG: hypothetical protein FJ087_17855 [Deltaproteobacteria bacterium]|nr:hypothetical protein [Deltaproteobacteria bacterium]